MAHQLNNRVAREDGVRAVLPELAYVKRLKENGEALLIDNVLVDAPQIIERRFVCDTRHCVRRTKKRKRYKGSCCTDLEVDLTPNEIRSIRRLARAYLASPAADPESPEHAVARWIVEDGSWFEENYRGEICLSHSKEKVCAMGFIDEDGRLLCALNCMAEALGEPLAKWKLITCYAFPLHYVKYEKGKYLLTVICKENHENLDATKDIGKLRCIRRPPENAPRAYESLRGEIEHMFGARFCRKLREAAKRRLNE